MTETQRKFLTEYLGETIFPNPYQLKEIVKLNRTFATAQDKQDLLEAVIEKGEWLIEYVGFARYLKAEYNQQCVEGHYRNVFTAWLIQLSPLETAELICKWKGVE